MQCHWILGAGAIGRLLAHSLTTSTDVLLIGRRALPARQRLTTPTGEERSQVLAIHSAAELRRHHPGSPDVLHITTKAMAVEEALEGLAGLIAPTTPLVLWQNGFLAQPRLTERWAGPVLCASTTEGAYLTGDDALVHAGHGQTWLGDLHHRHGDLAQTLATALNDAGLTTIATGDIRGRLWQKLAINAVINPMAALNGIRNGALREAAYACRVDAIILEIAAVMQAEGISPANPQAGGESPSWQTVVWGVVDSTAGNKASMLQDVEARRPTERGAILTPLIDSAVRHGLPHHELTALDQALIALERHYQPPFT